MTSAEWLRYMRKNDPNYQLKERRRSRERYRTDPRVKARKKAQTAKRRGLQKNKPCNKCGSKKNIELHHPDHSKPLVTVPLCFACHRELHKKIKPKILNWQGMKSTDDKVDFFNEMEPARYCNCPCKECGFHYLNDQGENLNDNDTPLCGEW